MSEPIIPPFLEPNEMLSITMCYDNEACQAMSDLMENTGIDSIYEVINQAVLLFTKCVELEMEGKMIVAWDDKNRTIHQLAMTAFEHAKAVGQL